MPLFGCRLRVSAQNIKADLKHVAFAVGFSCACTVSAAGRGLFLWWHVLAVWNTCWGKGMLLKQGHWCWFAARETWSCYSQQLLAVTCILLQFNPWCCMSAFLHPQMSVLFVHLWLCLHLMPFLLKCWVQGLSPDASDSYCVCFECLWFLVSPEQQVSEGKNTCEGKKKEWSQAKRLWEVPRGWIRWASGLFPSVSSFGTSRTCWLMWCCLSHLSCCSVWLCVCCKTNVQIQESSGEMGEIWLGISVDLQD